MKKYICDICKKKVPKTNYNTRYINSQLMGLCGKHYAQYLKFGKFLDNNPRSIADLNEFKVEGEIAKIYTFNKKGDISGFFEIDREDLDKVIVRKWRLWKDRFFTGVQKPTTISHFIMGEIPEGYVVDHIDNNPANNKKENLRIVTQQQNIMNSPIKNNNKSGFTGIYYDIGRDKWAVEIKYNYKKCFLGRYNLLEDACFARYTAEKILFEEFRNTKNDNNLVPMAEKSENKKNLTKYVEKRIKEKFAD